MIKLIKKIVDDTLKRDKDGVRRFSKTALTMLSAWLLACYTYIHDFIVHGFRLDTFVIMIGVATGMKVTDAISKKLNNNNSHQ